MYMLLQFLNHFVEYREWYQGLTAVGFVVSVLGTAIIVPGLVAQARKIWHDKSGEGVVVFTIITILGFALIFGTYSAMTGKASALINASIAAVILVPILIGLYRFKGFEKYDWVMLFVYASAVLAIFIYPPVTIYLYVIGAVVVWIGTFVQGYRIFLEGERKEVSPWMYGLLFTSSLTLALYGLAVGDLYIATINLAFAAVQGLTALLAITYRS